MFGIFVLLLLLSLPFLKGGDDAPSQSNAAQQPIKSNSNNDELSNKITIQTDSRIALKAYLKDSDSAEIRNHKGVCGEVNSKNSFGGYGGFKRFIASSAIVAIEGENMDSSEFQNAWDQVC